MQGPAKNDVNQAAESQKGSVISSVMKGALCIDRQGLNLEQLLPKPRREQPQQFLTSNPTPKGALPVFLEMGFEVFERYDKADGYKEGRYGEEDGLREFQKQPYDYSIAPAIPSRPELSDDCSGGTQRAWDVFSAPHPW